MKDNTFDELEIICDSCDRTVKLSNVRMYCIELIQRGDTTPKEEDMLREILKVSGMEVE
jgi:hypothetical protein